MNTIIKCDNSIRKEIEEFLKNEFEEPLDLIDEDWIDIKYIDDGLAVEFPIGEIYGYTCDYVEIVPQIFAELKEKYKDIAIEGLVYEFETITCGTFGYYFHCDENDEELKIANKWQECAQCLEVVEGDAFYNSSQHDFEEGNLECLCCPTCMLEYSLNFDEYGEVETNTSFSEEESEEIHNAEDERKFIKTLLWKRIVDNVDNYLDDFKKHKDRIIAIAEKDLDEEKKEFIQMILEKIKKKG